MLTDEQVKERTDVTVKMANVVGESASTVSEWMTAIWNNFDDGTRSLESYADVLTRLGAATASSADEIAGGLEKFAAVADTVGLSYDYAATALATITATTRQSEDVVGNALKTIFARIQGLSLGETLEDGVNLNKYSQALADVGIQVLDVNGQLRDMDDLLPEIGEKWGTLSKAQQTALAQTVAGVRQYTQFVALFDNWDTFQTNLAITQGAEGDLQNQADIYEESWAAANKRLKASFEDLYDSVIDEDLFIDLTDGAALLVDGVAGVVDALGGMKGLLLLAGTIGSRVFAKDIANNAQAAYDKVNNLLSAFKQIEGTNPLGKGTTYLANKENARVNSARTGDSTTELGQQYLASLRAAQQNTDLSIGFRDQAQSLEQITRLQNQINANSKNLTESERQKLAIQLQEVQALSEQKAQTQQQLSDLQRQLEMLQERTSYDIFENIDIFDEFEEDDQFLYLIAEARSSRAADGLEELLSPDTIYATNGNTIELYDSEQKIIQLRERAITQYSTMASLNGQIRDIIQQQGISSQDRVNRAQQLIQAAVQEGRITQSNADILSQISVETFNSAESVRAYTGSMTQAESIARQVASAIGVSDQRLNEILVLTRQVNTAQQQNNSAVSAYNERLTSVRNQMEQMVNSVQKFGQSFTRSLQMISSGLMALNNWQNFGEMLGNPDISWIQKASTGIMALTMSVDAATSAFGGLKPAMTAFGQFKELQFSDSSLDLDYWDLFQEGLDQGLSEMEAMSEARQLLATQDQDNENERQNRINYTQSILQETLGIKEQTAAIIAKNIARETENGVTLSAINKALALSAAEKLNITVTATSTAGIWKQVAAYIALETAIGPLLLAFTALALVLGLGAIAYKQYQSEINKTENELKQLRETTVSIKSSIDDLSSAWSNLTSAENNLDNLVEGSLEWKQALIEVNEQVLALIDKYPELAKYMSVENGRFSISEEGYEQLLNNQISAYETTSAQTILRQTELTNKELSEAMSKSSIDAIKEAYPEYTAEINSLIKAKEHGTFTYENNDLNRNTNASRWDSQYGTKFMESFAYDTRNIGWDLEAQEKGEIYAEIVEAIFGVGEEINSAIIPYLGTIADASSAKNNTFLENKDIDYKNAYNAAFAQRYNDRYQQAYDEIYNSNINNGPTKDMAEEYFSIFLGNLEAQGYSVDKNIFASYGVKDSEGKWVEGYNPYINTVGYSTMAEGIASDKALTMDDSIYGELTTTINELNNNLFNNNDTLGEIDSSTRDQIMSSYLESGGTTFDLSGLNTEQTQEFIRNAIEMGFEEAALAAQETTRENIKQANSAWMNNKDSMEAADLQQTLEEAEMSAEAFEVYKDKLVETRKAAARTDKELEKINKELEENEEMLEKAAKEQLKLNNASKKINKTFKDYGKNLDDLSDEDYAKAITEINSAVNELFEYDFDASFIKDNINDIQDAANGSEEALGRLRGAAAQEIIATMNFEGYEVVQGKFNHIADMVAQGVDPLTVEATLEDAKFVDGLNQMLASGQISIADLQSSFNALGYTPNITYVDGPPQVTTSTTRGSVQVFGTSIPWSSVNTSEVDVKVPQIKNENKGRGGAGSAGNAFTNTGASKPSSSSSSGSGGGGGGGSRKPPEMKNDSDKERYHTLNNQLEDLEDAYDDISEAADRAFGKDKLEKIDEQVEALDILADKQEEYRKALQDDLGKDKAILEAYYADLFKGGPKMEFDAQGNISNFDAIQDYTYQFYNNNTVDLSEADWEIFEQKYEQYEKYLEQYEETYDLLREKENEIRDLANERLDLLVEQAQYKVELKLDISEDSLEILEYELSLLEDDALNLSSKIALLSEQTSTYYGQSQALSAGIEDILGKMQESGTMTEDAANALRDYKSQLIEVNENLLEMREAVQEGLVEAFEEWNDQIGEGLDKFDHYSSILDSYANIIDIVGKETLGIENEFLENLSQQQVSNSINNLAATREAYLSLEAAAAEAREKLAEAQAIDQDKLSESQKESIQKDILFWQEQLDTIEEEANSAAEDMYSTWEEALEAITTQFEQSVERAVEQFNEAVYGMGGLEQLSEDFARQQEMADMYLKDYEQIYELSKLNRDIQNSIDDTDSVAGKQKLKKLMQDINKLQAEGNEMSEYDLEYLQKTYDLRMAEIALEEAQHAKSQVRLQKDSEGNWAYVYTSAGDAVDEAQQKYEDALFAMQDVSSNYIDEMSEQLIATSQEMAEALANLRVEDFASQEEYEKKVAEVQETYAKQMAAQEAELNKAIDNNKVLYDTDWTNYSNATGYKISSTEEFVTSFKDSMLGLLTDSETDQSNFTSVIDAATEGLITGLLESASTFYTNLESAMVAAGTSTDKFATEAGEAIAELGKESEAARKSVSMLADEFTSGFASMTEAVQSWQGSYGTAIEAAIAANEEMAASINEVLEALSISPEDMTVSYNIYASGKHAASDETTAGYDTGGYTGQWGNSGKIAVLHEKELVLNKDDTTNMLAAVALVRTLTQTIDLNAARAGQGLGGLTASVMKDEVHETLEQQVTIHAEFPNVSDHNEVELALQNMINSSTQYANRK